MTPIAKGILLMVASMAFFTLLDTSAKLVQQSLDTFTAVFMRYAVSLALTSALVLRGASFQSLRTQHPYLQIFRGLCLVTATGFNFVAMKSLPLTTVAAIFFTIPLIVCALSALLLGEKVGPRRWAAVLVGFVGVLIIMRPGTMNFHPAMIFSIASSFMGAFYNIATRKVGGHDRAETSLFYVSLVGAAAGLLPLPWHWQTPQGWEWGFVLAMGLAGTIGHFMLIQAHRLAPAALLAPFIYTQIIWMTLSSILVFGDYPDLWTIVGAAIVVACGIYVWHRERVRRVTPDGASLPLQQ